MPFLSDWRPAVNLYGKWLQHTSAYLIVVFFQCMVTFLTSEVRSRCHRGKRNACHSCEIITAAIPAALPPLRTRNRCNGDPCVNERGRQRRTFTFRKALDKLEATRFCSGIAHLVAAPKLAQSPCDSAPIGYRSCCHRSVNIMIALQQSV